MSKTAQEIKETLASIIGFLKRYVVLIFILGFLGLYGFLVWRINVLSKAEPSDEALTEKLTSVQQTKIDQSSVDKIKQLQAQNLEVQTLFQQARQNPFSE